MNGMLNPKKFLKNWGLRHNNEIFFTIKVFTISKKVYILIFINVIKT